MGVNQDYDSERELAIFSLAIRYARKEIKDLPKVSDLDTQGFLRASELVESKYFEKAASVVDYSVNSGVFVISCLSKNYPKSLLNILGVPEVLFIKGDLTPYLELPTIAIVGSRRPTREGRQLAENLGYDIALSGGGVVSGLAYGCDVAAHTGSMKARSSINYPGAGIAVLGCGVNNIYPHEHQRISEEFLSKGGVIISELEVDSSPQKGSFPSRNRIISGLSQAVIVVEAGERSGSLITARFAAEQGRELYAVPGSYYLETAKGTNRLLKEGAIPLTEFSDLRSIFPVRKVSSETLRIPEDPILRSLVKNSSLSLEELCDKLGLTPSGVLPKLVKYEMEGIVTSEEGRFYLSSLSK